MLVYLKVFFCKQFVIFLYFLLVLSIFIFYVTYQNILGESRIISYVPNTIPTYFQTRINPLPKFSKLNLLQYPFIPSADYFYNQSFMPSYPKSSTLFFVFSLLIITSLAQICPPGFDRVPLNAPFGVCVILGCSKAIKDQPCAVDCIEGYSKKLSNFCQVVKCASESKTICTSCQQGYQLQAHPTSSAIRICVPSNCQSFDRSTRICQKCLEGFRLSSNGTCSIANCLQSKAGSSECQKCKQGFSLKKLSSNFEACLPNNCLQYSNDTYQCIECQPQNMITKEGSCRRGIPYCTKFNEISFTCFQCQAGYQLALLKRCHKIDPLCSRYGLQGCTECKQRYHRANKGRCQANFCDQTDINNPLKCQKCEPGYTTNKDGLCIVDNCQTFDIKSWRCFQCNNFFDLVSLPSVLNQLVIVQRCLTVFCDSYDENKVFCRKCSENFTLSNGICTFSNCQKIGSRGCEQCVEGWRQNQWGSCVIYDCLQFQNARKCKSCGSGMRPYRDTCYRDNCVLRNSGNGVCALCPIDMQIHPVFPKFCVYRFCKKIDQQTGDCLQCLPTFKLSQKGVCESTICQKYENKTGFVGPQCAQCKDGYQPSGPVCIASKKYCENYVLQQGVCKKCATGYQLNSNNALCTPVKCISSNFAATYGSCNKCGVGYRLINFENKTQKCEPYNCTQFSSQGPECKSCAKGFYLFSDICLALNCKDFDDSGICSRCNEGFYLNESLRTCFREKCQQDGVDACKKCQIWFYPDNNDPVAKGVCKPYNCQVVEFIDRSTLPNKASSSGTVKCRKCLEGFVPMPNIQMCYAQDCAIIDPNNGTCRECLTGFQLKADGRCYLIRMNAYCPDGKYPDSNFLCSPIKAKFCSGANPRNTAQCYKCLPGYFLRNGTCRQYINCIQKNYYLGCVKCQPGYQINFSTGECQGKVPRCKSYDNVSEDCRECEQGFQIILYPRKSCKLIPQWCLTLDPNGDCSQCKSPQRTLYDKKCIFSTEKCVDYEINRGFCTSCENGFYLNNGLERPVCIQNPPNCLQAISTGQCIKCAQNNMLNQGVCFAPINRCIGYQKQFCIRCFPGFYVGSSRVQCRQLPRFCSKITSFVNDVCDQCILDFINLNGVCVKPIQFCTDYAPSGKCLSCISGYRPSSNNLICLLA